MNLANKKVVGADIKRLAESLNTTMFLLQLDLGMYTPTISRITNEKLINQPIDRVFCGSIRFMTHNYPEILQKGNEPRNHLHIFSLQDLYEANKVSQIYINDVELDPTDISHLSIILFRSYGSARNFSKGKTELTMPIQRWVSWVCYCLEEYQGELIEKVIMEEAEAWGVDLDELLHDGWKSHPVE